MVPLKEISVKSAKRKNKKSLEASAADPQKSSFKRDVSSIIDNLNKMLDKEKPVTEHVYSVLSKSEIGSKTSVGQHFNHLFKLNQLGDHQYIKKGDFEKHLLGIDQNKSKIIQAYIDNECVDNIIQDSENKNDVTVEKIILQDELPIKILHSSNVYDMSCKYYKETMQEINDQLSNCSEDTPKSIKIDISFQEAPAPSGTNYVNTEQNSELWHKTRNKKITGSRLGSLICMHGNKKFTDTWEIVETGKKESDISGIKNIKRGLMFEKDGIKYFERESKSITQTCVFFYYPCNNRYGSSPGAIGKNGILVEIKTRAKNSIGPLQNLNSCPHYYVQCQLQMACTDAHSCVLVSYHPETKFGNFFLVQRNNIIIDILIDVCNAILDKTVIDTWVYNETNK